MQFVRNANKFLFISIALLIGAFLIVFTKGLKIGIDFAGGGVVYFTGNLTDKNISDLTQKLSSQIDHFSIKKDNDLNKISFSNENNYENTIKNIKNSLLEIDKMEIVKSDFIGNQFGKDIVINSIIAIFVALFSVFIYIWFKFGLRLSIGASICLVHDCIVIIGFCALMQIEINLMTISALLTIIGYSINDTIVVYDRIRQNILEKTLKKEKFNQTEIVDISIKSVLKRSIVTSFVTILAIFSLLFVKEENIQNFILALIPGIVCGTYSSIFIAAMTAKFGNIKIKLPKNQSEIEDPMRYV